MPPLPAALVLAGVLAVGIFIGMVVGFTLAWRAGAGHRERE